MKRGRTAVVAISAGVLLFVAVGCGSQVPVSSPPVKKVQPAPLAQPFEAMQEKAIAYLKQNKPLVITPEEVYTKVVTGGDTGYLLVDVRNDEHYANAHIPGSIHINYGDAWREDKIAHLPKDKKIVVIDYSGHAASQVAVLWNMLGLDAVPMQNGMAGWTKSKDIIGGSPKACEAMNYPVVTDVPASSDYELPVIETKAASINELVVLQAKTASEKPVVIQATELKEKMASGRYFIVDLRAPEHYRAGHIAGAVNIPFRSVAEQVNLKKMPHDKQIVMVCYDGHAASQAARIVNQLGYNAVALRDGMSVWNTDTHVIGAPAIACAHVPENPVVKLNAALKASSGGAAT